MNDKAMLTEKDLDLAGGKAKVEGDDETKAEDKSQADDKSQIDGQKDEGKGGDVTDGKGDGKAKSGDIFDDIDDDDDDVIDDKKSDDGKAKSDPDPKDDPAKDDKSDDGKKDGDDDKDDAPGDWREALASHILKGQEDRLTGSQLKKAKTGLLKDLGRFKSEQDYMAAGYAARQKIRSGEYRTSFPGDEASDEDKAAWRKQNGIPEKETEYQAPDINGHKWDDDSSLLFDDFRPIALRNNLNQGQVADLTEWQLRRAKEVEEDLESRMTAQDRDDREISDDSLRTRYGVGDFKPRKAIVKRLLEDEEVLPDNAGERLMNSRYYDPETGLWRKIMNDPDVMRLLIDRAEYEYGDAGFTPHTETVRDRSRLKELEELRDKDYDAYMRPGSGGKSPADEMMDLQRKEANRNSRRGRQSAV